MESVPTSLPKKKSRHRYAPVSTEMSPMSQAVCDAVRAICQKYNYEPLEEMIKLRTTKVPLFRNGKEVLDEKGEVVWVPLCGMKEAADIDKEICKYVHSQKPRAVDMSVSGSRGITVLVAPLTAPLDEALAETPAGLTVGEQEKQEGENDSGQGA